MAADGDLDLWALTDLLAKRGLEAFRATKRGKTLIIVSGPDDDPDPHARMTRIGPCNWRLDVRDHTERWEPTPFTGNLPELLDALVDIGRLDPRDA